MPALPLPTRKDIIDRRAKQFGTIIRHLALGQPIAPNSNARLAFDGANKLPEIITRAGVPAIPLGPETDPGLAAYGSVQVAWLQSLYSSAFDVMLPSMRNVPFLSKIAITTTGFLASEEDQGLGIPLGAMVLSAPGALAPRKVTVITAATEELLRTSQGEEIFSEELKLGVARGTDVSFITDLIAANSPIASSAAFADIAALVDAIKMDVSSKPFFIMSPARRQKAITLVSTSGYPLFPELQVYNDPDEGPSEILSIPVVASDKISDSAIVLVDCNQLFAASGVLELARSGQADVEMADIVTIASLGGSPSEPTPTQITSMFQAGAKAIRATRYFSWRIGRSTAVASISGISW